MDTLAGARDELLAVRPDVLLLDLELGTLGSGENLIVPMVRAGVVVVVVSAFLSDVVMGRCLTLGAAACIPKSAPLDVLLTAVTSLAAGEPLVPSAERQRVLSAFWEWQSKSAKAHRGFERLTLREAHVLGEIMAGLSVGDIAERSGVSQTTVRSQVRAILMKLDVRSQLQAVTAAVAAGWSAPPAA